MYNFDIFRLLFCAFLPNWMQIRFLFAQSVATVHFQRFAFTFDKTNHLLLAQIQAFFFISRFLFSSKNLKPAWGFIKMEDGYGKSVLKCPAFEMILDIYKKICHIIQFTWFKWISSPKNFAYIHSYKKLWTWFHSFLLYVHIRNSGNSLTQSRTLRFHFLYKKQV